MGRIRRPAPARRTRALVRRKATGTAQGQRGGCGLRLTGPFSFEAVLARMASYVARRRPSIALPFTNAPLRASAALEIGACVPGGGLVDCGKAQRTIEKMNEAIDQFSFADVNNIAMRTISTSDESEVSQSTIIKFQQNGRTIAGSYSGGKIVYGFLVGKYTDRLRGEFRYVQIADNGLIDAGKSTFVLEVSGHEVVRLIECYEWTSRIGMGVNVFEKIGLR